MFFLIIVFNTDSFSDIVNKIEIKGNQRISAETVQLFSKVEIGENINQIDINLILKDLYKTSFFEDVKIQLKNNTLVIFVKEYPLIQTINYNGIKSSKILENVTYNKLIKEKSSYNKFSLITEQNRILNVIKDLGYYNASIDTNLIELDDNLVSINFDIQLGKKAKINKITFVGNKIFKDRKLRRLIASSEYKFWKFLSGRKFLNENLVNLDKRLLKNYYLNNGYYEVVINSSFAKLINNNEFELIFNIDAKRKIFFGDIELKIPSDFDINNFKKLNNLFDKINGQPYSINTIDDILSEIDIITAQEQYQFIKATVTDELIDNKINLIFKIEESEKYYVEKINIFGNTVTQENVIRNQLELDEGDPFNEILLNKSINNIKSLNFFKTVKNESLSGTKPNTKILNISIAEKPTGEISASAGIGTGGGSIGFGINENNFMGKGVSLDSNIQVSSETIKGKFGLTNPNFNNTDKSIYINAEAIENDNFKTFGYKSTKTGINFGTNFEYLDDLRLGVGTSNFYEVIKTNSTASKSQQDQEGNYWDTFLNLDFNYDKRNQKFQTSSGYNSFYSLDLPVISERKTIVNYYNYSHYFDLYDENISSLSLMLKSATSLANKDIKLSERLNIPSNKLRGFESGKIGPKDGDDYIGGNYAYAINFSSTIPKILEESQNVDFLFFIDAANLWGIDYDKSLKENGKIRSSTGIALDWYSPIGPLNFSLAYPITKESSDKEETFRFNLGTTF
ncbi:outer membrane protein assembly factor BamA [Candidatus Pelagibacter bacterium nBUS_27]|uniref:outer membrane protein assembly factor BamA n=1 Tax=Candidatus Pelagibacter bacterium nBUS_27 TaxID=3374188 RepID=UPI003EBFCF9D